MEGWSSVIRSVRTPGTVPLALISLVSYLRAASRQYLSCDPGHILGGSRAGRSPGFHVNANASICAAAFFCADRAAS